MKKMFNLIRVLILLSFLGLLALPVRANDDTKVYKIPSELESSQKISLLGYGGRFQNVFLNDIISTSFDTITLCYVNDPYRDEKLLDVWVKTTEIDGGDYNLNRYYLRLKERQYQLVSTFKISSQGEEISRETYPYSSKFKEVIPESSFEKVYDAVRKYQKEFLKEEK